MAALEQRHLAALKFAELRRGLQALSSLYVERRGRLDAGSALQGAGKRAAFAAFYAPLHFLLAREVVRALAAAVPPPRQVVDLGCGSGAAGAAWALEAGDVRVYGVDRHPWAVAEARWTFGRLGLRGEARQADLVTARLPGGGAGIVAAFALNELPDPARDRLAAALLEAAGRGARVLVLEPLARGAAPWWPRLAERFLAAGGRDDAWRFRVPLPELVARLDRASGLDHSELRGRSLYAGGGR